MTIKEKLESLRIQLSKTLLNLSEVETAEGVKVVYEGDSIVTGSTALFIYDESGAQVPATDGVYTIDGVAYNVAGGIVVDVVAEEVEAAEEIPAEDPVEVTVEEVVVEVADIVEEVVAEEIDPIVALTDIVTKLTEKLAELEAKVGGVETQMSKISDEPVSKPAEIVIKDSVVSTGNLKADKIRNILQGK